MKSLENLVPKLVIAPAFLLGLTFIYGFMIWNGVLSVTNSRMLPNYDEFVGLEQYARLWDMDTGMWPSKTWEFSACSTWAARWQWV